MSEAQNADSPVLIACRTIIGFGVPTRAGTQKAHSDAPGAEEVAGARKALDWPYAALRDAGRCSRRMARHRRAAAQPAREAWDARKSRSRQAKEFDDAICGDDPGVACAAR